MQFRKYSLRLISLFLTFILLLLAFSVKLVLIQVFRSSHLARLAEKQHNHILELEPIRGRILDRNLRPLALNVTAYSLFANPRMMSEGDKARTIEALPGVIDVKKSLLQNRLNRDKFFVWIQRKLPKDQADTVKALGIKGLDFVKESQRIYPNKSLASHVIGFSGIDNSGLEGLERYFDSYLKGKPGYSQILRDARQQDLMIEKKYVAPKDGYHLVLTIDETIQYIAERALERAFQTFKAMSGSVIVMDVRTGDILAMANRPTYDLQNIQASPVAHRVNRAVSFVYEPGSVFKIVTAAAALEENIFTEDDIIYCENGQYRIANHTLHDHRPHGDLTFRQVFELSSNIGTAKVAQKMGGELVYEYGQRFGFGTKTGITMPGEVNGWLKHPSRWSKLTIGSIPMGHEVTVTPLQMVTALAAVANDGLMMRPRIVKAIKDSQDQVIESYFPTVDRRVISVSTARRLQSILQGVVENGTGRRVQMDGIAVGGKSGTAQKVIDGQYSHEKFYATFIAFAPVEAPRLAAIVVLDEPRPQYFGGTVAGPVVKEIFTNVFRYYLMNDE